MDDLLTQTNDLINKGRRSLASTKLESLKNYSVYSADPRYWFQRSLLARLKGDAAKAQHYINLGKACPGWTDTFQGDAHRDAALMLARQAATFRPASQQFKALEKNALAEIQLAKTLFQGDANRLASITMTEARLEYARWHYRAAVALHVRAATQLTNSSWILNNQFHLLRANRRASGRKVSGLSFALTKKIIKKDPNTQHKIAAVFIFLTGGFGCRLYDRIAA